MLSCFYQLFLLISFTFLWCFYELIITTHTTKNIREKIQFGTEPRYTLGF
nr:MAG TPA: hypothetical protein [Caudoviricetes sp.]